MKKRYTLLFLLLTLSYAGFCQNEAEAARSYMIGLSPQFTSLSILDKNISPLIHRGNIGGIALLFQAKSLKSQFHVRLGASLGDYHLKRHPTRELHFEFEDALGEKLDTTVELSESIFLPKLTIQYLRNWNQNTQSPWRFSLGGSLNGELPFPLNQTNAGVASVLDFSVVGQFSYRLQKQNRISAQIALPIATIITRLPYYYSPVIPETGTFVSFYTEGTRVASWNSFQRVHLHLDYSFYTSKRIQLAANWTAIWMQDLHNSGYNSLHNQFGFNLWFIL